MQQPPSPPRLPYPAACIQRQEPAPLSQHAWHWYRSASRKVQVGIGILVFLLLLCLCASVAAASMARNALLAPTAIQTPIATPIPILMPPATLLPTAMPTATPTSARALTSTHRPSPHVLSTPQPPQAPTPTLCPAVNCNPWGYNFVPGHRISSPPSAFCRSFACIPNFGDGHGYVVQCHDGLYSKSGGRACSNHGGVWRTLYAH